MASIVPVLVALQERRLSEQRRREEIEEETVDPLEYKGKPAQGDSAPIGYVDDDEDRRS